MKSSPQMQKSSNSINNQTSNLPFMQCSIKVITIVMKMLLFSNDILNKMSLSSSFTEWRTEPQSINVLPLIYSLMCPIFSSTKAFVKSTVSISAIIQHNYSAGHSSLCFLFFFSFFWLLVLNAANIIRATGEQLSACDDNKKTSTALDLVCSEWEFHPLSS